MILSIPTLSSVASTNLTDNTEPFNDAIIKTWYEGDEVQHDDNIYVATEDIPVQAFNGITLGYKAGDLVSSASEPKTQVMYSTSGEAPANPSEYSTVDTSVDYSVWTERYMKLPSMNFTVTPNAGPDILYDFQIEDTTMLVTIKTVETSSTYYNVYAMPIYSLITSLTPDTQAVLENNPNATDDVWVPYLFFQDANGVYIRTNLAVAEEVITKTDTYLFRDVTSPADTHFAYIQKTNNERPFDQKNYSKSYRTAGDMQYTIMLNEDTNMFVLGSVKGTSFSYSFSGAGGSGNNIPIDGTRDNSGVLSDWYTTIIIYADATVAAGGTLNITIQGDELGSFLSGAKIDAGMSTKTFSNSFKDFSTFEYDPWGNPNYIERAKVMTYTGTVDLPIDHYDRINRLMSSLGKNIVIVDGSDNLSNTQTDSVNVFASTQFIGRTMRWDQKTQLRNKDMDELATYSFNFEEIVTLALVSMTSLASLAGDAVCFL